MNTIEIFIFGVSLLFIWVFAHIYSCIKYDEEKFKRELEESFKEIDARWVEVERKQKEWEDEYRKQEEIQERIRVRREEKVYVGKGKNWRM
jgi:hypothetical protein